MLEIGIDAWIEYSLNIFIERTYPGFVVPVDDPGNIKKHGFRFPIGDLKEIHSCENISLIFHWNVANVTISGKSVK
jgi:hypothetical protein